jgi:hypothetical protein
VITLFKTSRLKKMLLLVILSAAIYIITCGQQQTRKFGVEINQFIVGSGFGTGSELQVFVLDDKGRKLSTGIYYNPKFKRIGGISTSFHKMLRNHKKFQGQILEPYFFYNFIYHRTTITKPRISDTYVVAAGTYKSMEHHVGLGLRVTFIKSIYVTTELGYGIYLGSIMKPSKPDPVLNESYGTSGTGAIVKIGMGTSF